MNDVEPDDPSDFAALLASINQTNACVGVMGLGYVGLPLAMSAVEAGFPVLGFDVDPERVAQINRGESFTASVASEGIRLAVERGRLEVTVDFDLLARADAIVIAVPTPLSKQREPDLSFVINSTKLIARHLRRCQLVVLESTTYPGTTREVVKPILEETGLKSGEDFFLAFSPEREDPGNAEFSTRTIPRVVGGDGERA